MAKRRVCHTCGHGATEKLLESLQENPTPKKKTNRKPPPGRKSKATKTQEWAQQVLQRYSK